MPTDLFTLALKPRFWNHHRQNTQYHFNDLLCIDFSVLACSELEFTESVMNFPGSMNFPANLPTAVLNISVSLMNTVRRRHRMSRNKKALVVQSKWRWCEKGSRPVHVDGRCWSETAAFFREQSLQALAACFSWLRENIDKLQKTGTTRSGFFGASPFLRQERCSEGQAVTRVKLQRPEFFWFWKFKKSLDRLHEPYHKGVRHMSKRCIYDVQELPN